MIRIAEAPTAADRHEARSRTLGRIMVGTCITPCATTFGGATGDGAIRPTSTPAVCRDRRIGAHFGPVELRTGGGRARSDRVDASIGKTGTVARRLTRR